MGVALYIDSPDGEAPEYNGLSLRRALTGLLYRGAANSTGARSGLFPSVRPDHVFILGSGALRVPAITGVVWQGDPANGAYIVNENTQDFNIPAADGSLPRIDSVYMRVLDDSQDDSGEYDFVVDYEMGTPSSSPSPPALPNDAHRLANVSVPAAGSGQPSVTNVHNWTAAAGGVLPCRTASELPSSNVMIGMAAYIVSERRLVVYNGDSWGTVAVETPPVAYNKQPGTFQFTSNGNYLSTAASGSYVHCQTVFTAPASGIVRIEYGARLGKTGGGNTTARIAPRVATGGTPGGGTVVREPGEYETCSINGASTNDSTTTNNSKHQMMLVDGLTPFATYNVRLMHRGSSGGNGAASERYVVVTPVV